MKVTYNVNSYINTIADAHKCPGLAIGSGKEIGKERSGQSLEASFGIARSARGTELETPTGSDSIDLECSGVERAEKWNDITDIYAQARVTSRHFDTA